MISMDVAQINLQVHFGGGEVYTKFLCWTLHRLGIRTILFHAAGARFWQDMGLPSSTLLRPVTSAGEITAQLPASRSWVISHGPLQATDAQAIARHNLLTGIAHMPPQGRPRDRYDHYHCVFGVSGYVVEGLRGIGVPVWDRALYGVADLHRTAGNAEIRQTSCYEWDRRKGRDRLLGWLEPLAERCRSRPLFERRDGITLGIVSRLTPIKQFPRLFRNVVLQMVRRPQFNLEIFGAGGYASVRDLRRAIAPLGRRARFWGYQRDVATVYRNIDYLLTGLPEKEALGLNVIEAQACGTPVIGVNAPPFTETIVDQLTGLLYTDPRLDEGEDFGRVLSRVSSESFHIVQADTVTRHLSKFSEDAFAARIESIVQFVKENL